MMRGGAACAGGAAAGSTVCQAPRRGGARSSASAVFVFGRRERLYVAAACVCAGPAGPCPAACLRGLERHGSACACARPLPCLPPACLALGATGACAAAAVAAAGAAGRRHCATSRRRHAHASCTRARARMTHILHAPRTQPWRPLRSSLRTCARCREVSPSPDQVCLARRAPLQHVLIRGGLTEEPMSTLSRTAHRIHEARKQVPT